MYQWDLNKNLDDAMCLKVIAFAGCLEVDCFLFWYSFICAFRMELINYHLSTIMDIFVGFSSAQTGKTMCFCDIMNSIYSQIYIAKVPCLTLWVFQSSNLHIPVLNVTGLSITSKFTSWLNYMRVKSNAVKTMFAGLSLGDLDNKRRSY